MKTYYSVINIRGTHSSVDIFCVEQGRYSVSGQESVAHSIRPRVSLTTNEPTKDKHFRFRCGVHLYFMSTRRVSENRTTTPVQPVTYSEIKFTDEFLSVKSRTPFLNIVSKQPPQASLTKFSIP
ncbi:hypothetical protein CBL_07258 [Carabus blaptoides fortunei]